MQQIRVLVVDDSFFIRKRLVEMLTSDPEITVVDTAQNGLEAVKKVASLNPDVVTLDIEMPGMDGLTALGRIMKENPTPVIMVSTLTEEGSEATAQALLEGAVDFIHKPTDLPHIKLPQIKEGLVSKVKTVARSHPKRMTIERTVKSIAQPSSATLAVARNKIVMIGSSTGGPRALIEVLPRLPKNFPSPIAIVQHMPPGPFIKSIAKRIESESNIRIEEAKDGDRLEPGVALMAPGGAHMLIEKNGIVKLNHGPAVNAVKPSVDVLMESGASVYGAHAVGVVLTGMGKDGANGMFLIRKKGGRTIAEHESTCIVYGMPKVVIENGDADVITPLNKVAQEIMRMIGENTDDGRLCG